MRHVRAVLAAILSACALVAIPLAAGQAQPAAPASRPLTLSREERAAVTALRAAAAGPDRAAQDSALAAARSATRGVDARYAVASLAYQIARARGDVRGMNTAADEMLATNLPQGAELAALLASQASRAYSANDLRRADAILARMVEAQPNNPAVLADHGQFKARLGDRPAAVALFQRALAAQRALGQPAPESWHQRALAIAVDGRLAAQSATLGRELVVNYPNPANWRDALLALRVGEPPRPAGTAIAPPADPALDLDIRRLARAAEALAGERDYLEFAQALSRTSPGEAKAVLDEGVSRGALDANEAIVRQQFTAVTARAAQERAGLAASRARALAGDAAAMVAAGDAHFGNGQYLPAAELYRSALQRGAVDPALVNTRLGAALALGGQRVEAETVLRAVTGPRTGLASYWLAWIARRPG
ncbi:hypothetical protein [Sphingosinicella sp.]|uniref:hypothetical protein n=1 Tax=Sphingosinicella sp. TaxID=1917971 RepID=UPI004037CF78